MQTLEYVMYVYGLCLFYFILQLKIYIYLVTIFYHLVAKWRLKDFVNFKPCEEQDGQIIHLRWEDFLSHARPQTPQMD